MKVILMYRKIGMMRFLSPLETAKAIERNLRRAKVDFVFSKGFHPSPIISYLDSISTGVVVRQLFLTVKVNSWKEGTFENIKKTALNGLEPVKYWVSDIDINKIADGYKYRLILEKDYIKRDITEDVVIRKGRKRREYKLGDLVENLSMKHLEKYTVLEYTLKRENLFSPWELVNEICSEGGVFIPVLYEVLSKNKLLVEVLEG